MYEEVEAFTGTRPVLVFGALADQVVSSLLESCPGLFHSCPTGEGGEGGEGVMLACLLAVCRDCGDSQHSAHHRGALAARGGGGEPRGFQAGG